MFTLIININTSFECYYWAFFKKMSLKLGECKTYLSLNSVHTHTFLLLPISKVILMLIFKA